MSDVTILEAVTGRGWRRGLGPLMRAELSGWWKTRRWLVATVLWVAVINVFLLVTILGVRSETDAERRSRQAVVRATLEARAGQGDAAARARLERMDAGLPEDEAPQTLVLFCMFAGVFGGMGCALTLQGAIVGEKRSGTAEWVLSGPASRTSFALAKLGGNAVGVLATSVAVPAAIAWLEVTRVQGLDLPPLGFLAATAVVALHTLLFLALTVMSGAFFDHWAPVVAVPFAVLTAQSLLTGSLPALARFAPISLVLTAGEREAIAVSLARGADPATLAPVAVTAVLAVLFSAAAVLRFRRQEF